MNLDYVGRYFKNDNVQIVLSDGTQVDLIRRKKQNFGPGYAVLKKINSN